VPERVAAPDFEPVAVLTRTVGEILPVGLPDGDAEAVRDAIGVRVKEGEPEGLRDERPDRDIVGVALDVLLDETEPVAVLELVVVFETDVEPVIVLETLLDNVFAGDRDADFDNADVRVAVLVDVAVFEEREVMVRAAVPTTVLDGFADFVDVLEGAPEVLKGRGGGRMGYNQRPIGTSFPRGDSRCDNSSVHKRATTGFIRLRN
jgi:hypothetical protein